MQGSQGVWRFLNTCNFAVYHVHTDQAPANVEHVTTRRTILNFVMSKLCRRHEQKRYWHRAIIQRNHLAILISLN